jgi:hypothetical protein
MREVIVFLKTAAKADVHQFLSELYPSEGSTWVMEGENTGCLYIQFSEKNDFIEPEWNEFIESLSYVPSIVVDVRVSGRFAGVQEVKAFLSTILGKFDGHTMDDYTRHAWTLEDALSGRLVEGHPYFDYLGWYDEYNRDRGEKHPNN